MITKNSLTDRRPVAAEGVTRESYRLVTSQAAGDNGQPVSVYGIESTDAAADDAVSLGAISTDRALVQRIVDVLNAQRVAYVHFYDVLEDMTFFDLYRHS